MDSSALVRSGQIYRATSERRSLDFTKEFRCPWVSLLTTEEMNRLHPRDQDSVKEAERLLIRLYTQLEIEIEKGVEPEPHTSTANDKWKFLPGEVKYKNTKIIIVGVRWKLLKALFESERPLTESELIEAGWGHDAEVAAKTVYNHLTAIRKTLRKKLSLTPGDDPIPIVDVGRNRAWRLDDSFR